MISMSNLPEAVIKYFNQAYQTCCIASVFTNTKSFPRIYTDHLGPLLLTWFNFNPGMKE